MIIGPVVECRGRDEEFALDAAIAAHRRREPTVSDSQKMANRGTRQRGFGRWSDPVPRVPKSVQLLALTCHSF